MAKSCATIGARWSFIVVTRTWPSCEQCFLVKHASCNLYPAHSSVLSTSLPILCDLNFYRVYGGLNKEGKVGGAPQGCVRTRLVYGIYGERVDYICHDFTNQGSNSSPGSSVQRLLGRLS